MYRVSDNYKSKYRSTDIGYTIPGVAMCTDCECDTTAGRKFLTKSEKIEQLKTYHTWLTHEAKGVEEAIARIEARP